MRGKLALAGIVGDNGDMSIFNIVSSIASIFSLLGGDTSAIVNQGDAIVTGKDNSICTVGYVNRDKGVIYTSSHCVDGQGETVKNRFRKPIGEVVFHGEFRLHHNLGFSRDVAVIQLYPHVRAGENIYSGDTVANMDDIHPQDTLSSYGVSHGQVYTGTVSQENPYVNNVPMILSDPGMVPIPGDSGGPIWVEGKGFIGITSVTLTRESPTGEGKEQFLGGTVLSLQGMR